MGCLSYQVLVSWGNVESLLCKAVSKDQKGLLPSLNKLYSGNDRQEAIFQQDNAPAQTAKTTKSWSTIQWQWSFGLVSYQIFNSTENIWEHIKAKLSERIFTSIWKAVKREWKSMYTAKGCQICIIYIYYIIMCTRWIQYCVTLLHF